MVVTALLLTTLGRVNCVRLLEIVTDASKESISSLGRCTIWCTADEPTHCTRNAVTRSRAHSPQQHSYSKAQSTHSRAQCKQGRMGFKLPGHAMALVPLCTKKKTGGPGSERAGQQLQGCLQFN
eukprot:1137535-Pelagomonas_calceolata.AAC.3